MKQVKLNYLMNFVKKCKKSNKQFKIILKKRVDEASKTVADGKGLSVVLSRESVLFGGTDITEQVSKKISRN